MNTANPHVHSDPNEAIEALARTVAHLAVQLTITQLQLRGLGQVLEESGELLGEAVQRATSDLARRNASAFVAENLGPALAGLIDVSELEREIVRFLEPDPT